ncbi:CvpA family protein [Sphingomonas asaccharolytica]|uniref:CvpA family protein n=1 Tax=Sphingomonas asaccharolytica TaxID=40681 RepID=UPI000A067D17|nr:CvpA family protein [Sphingomonas asaccharolytica]
MGLTGLDIAVLLGVGAAAVLGWWRGFVTEVLSLLAWVLVVFALKALHTPVTAALTGIVGTSSGAAILAFALIAGIAYFGGRMLARAMGRRTKQSILGPLDRAMGFGFGALKGLILASLGFLLLVLVYDTIDGGPKQRPAWLTKSRTYPLLNATSAFVADFVAKRRKGQSIFSSDNASDVATNADDAADSANANDAPVSSKTNKAAPHRARPTR